MINSIQLDEGPLLPHVWVRRNFSRYDVDMWCHFCRTIRKWGLDPEEECEVRLLRKAVLERGKHRWRFPWSASVE